MDPRITITVVEANGNERKCKLESEEAFKL
jgi:hypothetical protein